MKFGTVQSTLKQLFIVNQQREGKSTITIKEYYYRRGPYHKDKTKKEAQTSNHINQKGPVS